MLHELYRIQLTVPHREKSGGECPVGQPYAQWLKVGERGDINCGSPESLAKVKQADEELVSLLKVGFDPYLRAGMSESAFTSTDPKFDLSMFPMVARVNEALGFGEDPMGAYAQEIQFLNRNGMAKDARVQRVKRLLQGEGRELLRQDLRAGLETVCDGDSWRRLLAMPGFVAKVKDQGCAEDGLFPVIDGCAREVVAAAKDRQDKAKFAVAGTCVIGGLIPVVDVPVGAACLAAFLGVSANDVMEATADKDLAVAVSSSGAKSIDQSLAKLQKLTEAKDEARLQVALGLLQLAGPALKAGKVVAMRLPGLKGFRALKPGAQASIEEFARAVQAAEAEPNLERRASRIDTAIARLGAETPEEVQAIQAAAKSRFGDQLNRWNGFTRLPREWVKTIFSGGFNDAALLRSPRGQKALFPSSPRVPRELWGQPIDGWFVKAPHGGGPQPGSEMSPEATEKALAQALPRVFEGSKWGVEKSLRVKLPTGEELIYERMSPGGHIIEVAQDVFLPGLTKSSGRLGSAERVDAVETLIAKISHPSTAPCFRGVEIDACAEAFLQLRKVGIDPDKVRHMIQNEPRPRNLAALLEDGATRVTHASGMDFEKPGPFALDPVRDSLTDTNIRSNRLYWDDEATYLMHRPDFSVENFRVESMGDDFRGHLFDF
jgi:hypothetical protein